VTLHPITGAAARHPYLGINAASEYVGCDFGAVQGRCSEAAMALQQDGGLARRTCRVQRPNKIRPERMAE